MGGEEPPTEEERQAEQELEDATRRVYDYDTKTFNYTKYKKLWNIELNFGVL